MPAGRGRLRRAIEDFIDTNPVTEKGRSWWDEVTRRYDETNVLFARINKLYPGRAIGHALTFTLCMIVYALFGSEWAIEEIRNEARETPESVFIQKYAEFWRTAFTPTVEAGTIEDIGSLLAEPVLALLGAARIGPGEDYESFLRRVFGVITAMVIPPSIAAGMVETLGFGQIESATNTVQTLTEKLGLATLGGSAVGLLAQSGFLHDMQIALNRHFRPAHFSGGEARDLFARGIIGRPELEDKLRSMGWAEKDITQWVDLAYTKIGEGDVWELYYLGAMTKDEVVKRLRAWGYSAEEIEWLWILRHEHRFSEEVDVSLRVVRQGLREGVIGEEEGADYLRRLHKSPDEVRIILAIERLQLEDNERRLGIADIRKAWEENILTDPEARHYLAQKRFSGKEIDLLLKMWKASIEPDFLKLNKGTIVGAYVEGVIDRTQAFRKLQGVGFADADARLELDLAEARAPEAFGKPTPRLAKQLAPGTLSDLLAAAFITPDDMLARLVELGYDQADAELLTAAAILRAEKELRPLTQSVVERAYVAGVIDRVTALVKLVDLDFTPEAAEIIVQTVEAGNLVVFAPESVQALRAPSTSALVEALRAGIIDEAAYFARMTEAGFDRATADMYLNLAIQSERRSGKTLTAAQILEAYSRDFINRAQGMSRLTSMGYGEADATMLLRFEKSGIEDTEPWKLLLSGALAPEDAFAQLSGMGFTVAEIEAAIAALQGE